VGYDFGDRTRPPYVADERTVLDGWLRFHRATLLWKCEELSDEQLRAQPLPTSRLSLLGLVRHLTDVERGWCLPFLGLPDTPLYGTDGDPDAEFDVADADPATDLARFTAETDALSDGLRDHGLDEVQSDAELTINLRWVLTHLIEEYARHNGHADLIRELVDGRTGD
jgi:uncharacterized damage-inducible protein DinB